MTDSWLRGFPSKCSVLRFGGVFCGFFSRLKPHIDMIDMIVSSSFRERRVFCIYIYILYLLLYPVDIRLYLHYSISHDPHVLWRDMDLLPCCHAFFVARQSEFLSSQFQPFRTSLWFVVFWTVNSDQHPGWFSTVRLERINPMTLL